MILVDTSGVLAAIDGGQAKHDAARRALEHADPPLIMSPFVLAELDYLLLTRYGRREQVELLGEVARGAYRLESFGQPDIARALEVMRKYEDLDLGIADASLVVLAERCDTGDILTLDERHFRVVAAPRGQSFRLLPADRR